LHIPACEKIVQAMKVQIGEPATQSGQQGRVTASVPIEYTASDGKTYRSYDTVCMPTGADVKSRSKLDKIKPKVHDDHASVSCTGRGPGTETVCHFQCQSDTNVDRRNPTRHFLALKSNSNRHLSSTGLKNGDRYISSRSKHNPSITSDVLH